MCRSNIPDAPVPFHLFEKLVPMLKRLVEMKCFPINLGGHVKK